MTTSDPGDTETPETPATPAAPANPERPTASRDGYRIDSQHPIGGEMSDILAGLFRRFQLKWHWRTIRVCRYWPSSASSTAASASASWRWWPSSLARRSSSLRSAQRRSSSSTRRPRRPRHLATRLSATRLAWWLATSGLVVTGLTMAGPAYAVGVTGPRVIAAALSLGLTSGLMVLLKSPHPPAGATTLIVSLGILTQPRRLVILLLAVVMLTVQAFVINRLAAIDYPLWSPRRDPSATHYGHAEPARMFSCHKSQR